jgi:spore coat polysaccharide biosynthesis protein SpsF
VNRIAVLQARTSSSRLPAKVLLPLGGMPLVMLAARRAANTGIPLLVATSTEPDDDGLAALLRDHGLAHHRGSLNNTLERVVDALAGREDNMVVIRLTADNVFPDGHLLDELVADFEARGLDYLCCNGEPSGLPYGMSAEVTRLRHLREAAAMTTDRFDCEHVTPYVVRKFGVTYFDKYKALGKGHYRCTIDTYDDYVGMQRVFRDEPYPVTAAALDLVARLDDAPYQPCAQNPVPRLVVGGAQLGMNYGIVNAEGQPARTTAMTMLRTAVANGVVYIDTARAYGESEAAIGAALSGGWFERVRVVTKLAPLDSSAIDVAASDLRARVDASVYESCVRLGRVSLDVVLLHRATHLSAWDGAIWKRLLELRDSGRIKALGVSVQTPEELDDALKIDEVCFVQMPFNMLDWRWQDAGQKLQAVKRRRDFNVHVRSALLQGLLRSRDRWLWQQAHVLTPELIWDWLDAQTRHCGRADVVDLCLGYVRAQPWIDGVVVGMESPEQLIANIRHFNTAALDSSQIAEVESSRPHLGADSLDPSQWRRA